MASDDVSVSTGNFLIEKFANLQWASQNALGALFTVLFSVVWRMSFTLSCVSTALYAAASQVLSLDRTVGGRLFAASIFVGCMLSGGVIGGAISSLAWTAHGSSDGLYHYFEEGIENPLLQNLTVVNNIEEEQIKQLAGQMIEFIDNNVLEKVAHVEPPFLLDGEDAVYNLIGSLFPAINAAYWVLLIVLFTIVCIPFAIARAHQNFKVGLLMGIATLFMGSQVVFATLTPIFGIRQYWTQIVSGYIKVALVNGGAMCCTALMIFVKSSHDKAREQMGQILQGSGAFLSKLSSNINQISNKSNKKDSLTPKTEEQCLNQLRKEAVALADETVADLGFKTSFHWKRNDEEDMCTPQSMPEISNSFILRGNCQEVEDSLAMCLFELPLPEISSHVGARRADFVALLNGIRAILSTLCCIETIHVQGAREIAEDLDLSRLSYVMASFSSCLAHLSLALNLVKTSKCCKGPGTLWRPKTPDFWEDIKNSIDNFASSATKTAMNRKTYVSSRGRDSMLFVMNLSTLAEDIHNCEELISKALDIPSEHVGIKENVENGLKQKILGNAYLPAILVHTALLSGGAVYALVIISCSKLYKGTKAFFQSREDRVKILRDRHVQYAFKYWLGLSLTIMSIVLILWKSKFSSENQLENAYNLTYFFFVWQPIYFWLTAAICIQFQVEAAAFRAVLRTTMTAIGGTLGWFTMMNGSLAQNPYFISGMITMFNGVCGLVSPIKEFRYSLFLTAFTFNAVVVCQYYGCCDLAGETNIYGGKVLSTLLGSIYSILLSWCVLPYYTSTKMLYLENQALGDGLSMVVKFDSVDQMRARKDPKSANYEENVLPTVEDIVEKIDDPLVMVHKELEANVIDKRQFLLVTWTLLPTPRIVYLLKIRLESMGVFLREFVKINSTPLWQSGELTEKYDQLLLDTGSHSNAVVEKARDVVTGCNMTFEATSRKSLDKARSDLALNITHLEHERMKLRSALAEWDKENEHEHWSETELKALAKRRLLHLTIKEIHVIGILLSETEATLDRDRWLSWASSWFGRRPM